MIDNIPESVLNYFPNGQIVPLDLSQSNVTQSYEELNVLTILKWVDLSKCYLGICRNFNIDKIFRKLQTNSNSQFESFE